MTQALATHVPAGSGETLWFGGAHQTVKSPGAWSDGRFSLVEVLAPHGRATPLHRDPSDETFYVLEGEMLFHVAGEELRARSGDTVSVPRGTAHAFVVASDLVKFLVLNTPGTHDAYFRDGGEAAVHQDFGDAPPPDHERMDASNRKHGVEILGPPPFEVPSQL